MNFIDCYNSNEAILIEGALGVRLRNEYSIMPDKDVSNASLIYQDDARKAIKEIFSQYIQIAEAYQFPIMLTTPTRRANKSNVEQSAYTEEIIRDNVLFLKELREEFSAKIYIGGMMGCKGDAYKATEILSVEEANAFHSWQARLFQKENVDYLYACIMPALSEAIGMAKAMEATGIPYIISFMIRDNGRLIDGTTIHDAMEAIEEATIRKPLCYMTNCVHPIILGKALSQSFNQTELVRTRFKGIQANASPLSPEELDNSHDLKSSDPLSLSEEMIKLYQKYRLKIFGGCCGTDQTHMEEIAKKLKQIGKNNIVHVP
jgi:S-methylmethionine-dependent homocysteine/selenocysteine methylase